ncbi:hypothetical protein COO60DRAFT_626400 [Scenedesmus sp. NREL 46B-D3]|nr:hypothetical protein COO60DRAFT_626400 [Scenedesmus sp. NREL 46B-D3]
MAMALSISRRHSIACLITVLIIAYISEADASCASVASVFGDADIASKLGAMIRQLNPREVKGADLPTSRPPPNTPSGWDFCGWECLQKVNVLVGEKGETKGIYDMEAVFQPLRGVNSSMMVWLFENLHRDAVYAVDGKTYPMYLIFHGVDHLLHTAHPADKVAVGTVFSWNEIPLTGCLHNRLSPTQPWSCPRNRTGYLHSDPTVAWGTKFHTKVNMTVTRFDSGGIEFIAQEKNPFFGGSNLRTIVSTRHTWVDSSSGLLLRTQQAVGLMEAGSDSAYDTSLIAPVINKPYKAFMSGAVAHQGGGWVQLLQGSEEALCLLSPNVSPWSASSWLLPSWAAACQPI